MTQLDWYRIKKNFKQRQIDVKLRWITHLNTPNELRKRLKILQVRLLPTVIDLIGSAPDLTVSTPDLTGSSYPQWSLQFCLQEFCNRCRHCLFLYPVWYKYRKKQHNNISFPQMVNLLMKSLLYLRFAVFSPFPAALHVIYSTYKEELRKQDNKMRLTKKLNNLCQ